MQLPVRVCSVVRVRTIQCSMQLTAVRFRYQLDLSSIAAPQIDVHRPVRASVAIGKPARQVRKASHCGSKQQ